MYERGLQIFRDSVVRNGRIKDRLQVMLLDRIDRERQGEMVERGLLRTATPMLVELGRDVYVREFEAPFLAASSTFYQVRTSTLTTRTRTRTGEFEAPFLAAASTFCQVATARTPCADPSPNSDPNPHPARLPSPRPSRRSSSRRTRRPIT